MKEHLQRRNLGFYHLGYGISVADRNKEVNGEFLKVAHIDHCRKVKYYVRLNSRDKETIENYAKTANPSVSTSQPEQKVFY